MTRRSTIDLNSLTWRSIEREKDLDLQFCTLYSQHLPKFFDELTVWSTSSLRRVTDRPSRKIRRLRCKENGCIYGCHSLKRKKQSGLVLVGSRNQSVGMYREIGILLHSPDGELSSGVSAFLSDSESVAAECAQHGEPTVCYFTKYHRAVKYREQFLRALRHLLS